LALLAVVASVALLLSDRLTSHAIQNPALSLDMVISGNTYTPTQDLNGDGLPDPGTNAMNVGAVDDCLATAAPGDNTEHTHVVHVIVQNVEDLVGWQMRVNYQGDKMRPSFVNFTPFSDPVYLQNISFVNLPVDPNLVHRDLVTATNIPPAAPGPQEATFGSAYTGLNDRPLSPDTPAKATPDDNTYSSPTGGVLARLTLQVLAGNTGQTLSMTPIAPGTSVSIFDGVGILQIVPQFRMSTHGEGVGCADSDGDGVLDVNDNCPNWPNPSQNLPPWSIPANDPDCDGFTTTVENSAGTDPLAHCGINAWPADIDNDTFVDIIGDIYRVAGQFGKPVPPAPARYDIAPDPPDRFIDVIGDISRLTALFTLSCA